MGHKAKGKYTPLNFLRALNTNVVVFDGSGEGKEGAREERIKKRLKTPFTFTPRSATAAVPTQTQE